MIEPISFIAEINNTGLNYYMIKNASGKAWLIPDGKAEFCQQALQLYQPVTIKGKLFKYLFPIMPKLIKGKIGTALKISIEDEWIEDLFGKYHLYYSIYLGTPSPHSKPTVQIMNEKNHILAYMKFSENESIKKILENEKKIISYLSEREINCAPNVIDYADRNGTRCLITDTKRTKKSKFVLNWNELYEKCLMDIYDKTIQSDVFSNSQVYKYIQSNINNVIKLISSDKFQKIEHAVSILNENGNKLIDLGFYHRDFKPWNCYFNKDKIHIFDFEYSMLECPVWLDKIHFIAQTERLVKNKSPEDIVGKIALWEIKDYRFKKLSVPLLLVIYSLDQFFLYFLRAGKADEEAAFFYRMLEYSLAWYKRMEKIDNE